MFTSDIDYEKIKARKMSLIYLCITAFCGLFSAVYEYFSHGVDSNFMIFLYMIPLIAGVLPYAALGLINILPCPTAVSRRVYNCGVTTLSLGCCLSGVLEIYGTSSIYIKYYWLTGLAGMTVGLILYLIAALSRAKERTRV